MKGLRRLLGAALALCVLVGSGATAQDAASFDVTPFIAQDGFGTIKISPDGTHYAATVPLGDRTVLTILRRADSVVTASFSLGRNRHVADLWWVAADRVVFSSAEKIGLLDEPMETGDLYTTTLDGRSDLLAGQSLQVESVGSNIRSKKSEAAFVFMADPRARDGRVVVSVVPFSDDPFTRADRMDVVTGRRATIARAPVRNARFATNNAGEVRAALGVGLDNRSQLHIRRGQGDDWVLINDERATGVVEAPIGFSADDATMYLWADRESGTDVILAYDLATGTRRELLSDPASDPGRVIEDAAGVPMGVQYLGAQPRTAFFDAGSATARQYRSLEAAFPGQSPMVTSSTRDGSRMLVEVVSDRNPGDFFVFDPVAKSAEHLISRRAEIDPDAMSATRAVTFKARDGLDLHGFLTTPAGVDGPAPPLVVLVHGGPFGVHDTWHYDNEVQMLAQAGYAVLRVNYRGSGSYGRKFRQAGAREWGGRMQDDVTDATRWAIAQGHADRARICIAGASYGAYAALTGVAREPDLYRCAIGYVGVYDLPQMATEAKREGRRIGTWSAEWVGDDPAALAAASPTRMADRIRVPVFLAAGGEDEVAPIEHTRRMERALRAAGVPVETLYVRTEGHGFHLPANRKAYYGQMLAFLGRHIGAGARGAAATSNTTGTPAPAETAKPAVTTDAGSATDAASATAGGSR